MRLLDELRGIPLLTGLHEAALAEVARRGVVRRFGNGALLWRVGDASRGLALVLEGRIRILRGHQGRQHLVHQEGPGATLGEVPLFAGGGYPAMARAASPSRCLFLGRADLDAIIRIDPQLATRLLDRMARRVRELVGRLDGRSGRTVAERLGGYLLDRFDSGGAGRRDGVDLGQTQADLAEDLGTVREVLVRELGRMCRRGMLRRTGRGRYALVDRAGLARLVGGEDG